MIEATRSVARVIESGVFTLPEPTRTLDGLKKAVPSALDVSPGWARWSLRATVRTVSPAT